MASHTGSFSRISLTSGFNLELTPDIETGARIGASVASNASFAPAPFKPIGYKDGDQDEARPGA